MWRETSEETTHFWRINQLHMGRYDLKERENRLLTPLSGATAPFYQRPPHLTSKKPSKKLENHFTSGYTGSGIVSRIHELQMATSKSPLYIPIVYRVQWHSYGKLGRQTARTIKLFRELFQLQ